MFKREWSHALELIQQTWRTAKGLRPTTPWLLVRVRRYNSAYLLYLYAYALGYSFLGKVRYGTNFSPDVLLKLDVYVFPGL